MLMSGLSLGASNSRLIHSSAFLWHFCSQAVENAAARAPAAALESKPKIIYGCRRDLKTSMEKLNFVARQIRGLPINRAILQMEASPKKPASQICQVLRITKRNAEKHENVVDPSKLFVLESYVGRAKHEYGVKLHARGQSHRMDHPRAHYYLKLQEGLPPAKEKKDSPILFTKRLQERIMTRPHRIPASLEQ